MEAVTTRADALDIIDRVSFDLVLLDLMLPDGSGYSVCTVIKHKKEIPIIFLTAIGDEASIVTGFDLGADDYVTKPFKPLELISRIKYALQRSGKSQSVFQITLRG